jgi:eukaryotic-like serine/threonine-protein kinase
MIIVCPECAHKYNLKDEAKTGNAKCKECGTVFDIQKHVAPTTESSADARTMVSATPPTPKPESGADDKTIITKAPPSAAAPADDKTIITQAPPPADDKTIITQGPATPSQAPTPPSDGGEDRMIGQTLGGYEILKKLGEGGMGAVYEARQLSLDRSVALKILPANLAANGDFVTRFVREAHSVAKLNHTNIVQIYDVGRSEGIYYFAMEFVRGHTIDGNIKKGEKMDVRTAVGYIIQAARGLEYAHRQGIIHRDIKPDNIMLNEEGVAKVADLGLAKQVESDEFNVTAAGVAMGTPYYMAPEQGTDAKNVDARADIYSLGCTLYHLVCGRIPYDGNSAYEIITKHLKEPLKPPSAISPHVPEDVSHVVEKMMAKDVADRYQDMGEVVADLEEVLGVNMARGWEATEEEIRIIGEQAAKVAPLRADSKSRMARFALCGLVLLGLILTPGLGTKFGLGLIATALVSLLAYGIIGGSKQKSYLYRRVRQYLFGSRIGDWLTMIVVLVALVGLVLMLGFAVPAIVGIVLGAAIAIGYYAVCRKPLFAKLEVELEATRKFVRAIRRQGVPEEMIHLFVARHAGEFLCEGLFGYEAMEATRALRSKEELDQRKRFLNLREWIIGRLNAAEGARRAEKDARIQAREATVAPIPAPASAQEEVDVNAATAVMEEAKTAVMPAAEITMPADAAQPADVMAVLEEPKASPAAMIVGIPKFLLSGKGRIILGAILLLLSGLSYREIAFSGSEGLRSSSWVIFALAIFISGFTKSAVMLLCLGLAILAAGPATWVGFMAEAKVPFADKLGEDIAKHVTLPALAGAFFFLLAFVAAFIFRGGKKEDILEPDKDTALSTDEGE